MARTTSPLAPLLEADLPGTRRRLTLLAAFAFAKAVGLILVADALAVGIGQVASGDRLDATRLAVWGLLGAGLRAGAIGATKLLAQRAGLGAKEELRSRLLRHRMTSRPATGHDDVGTVSALATRGLDGLDAYFTTYVPALMTAAVVPAVVGLRILAADWVSALIVALTVPLVPLFMVLIGLHTQERIAAAAAGVARLSSHLLELAQGLPALIGLRRAGAKRRALGEVSERYRATTMETLRTAFLSSLALELIATISVAVVAVFVGVRLVHGDMELTAGLVALILAPECFLPLREVGAAFHASEDGVEALRRTRERVDEAGRVRPVTPVAGVARVGAPAGGVELRGLAVEYDGEAVVGPVSLALRPGDVEVFDGPSGSGKTSLLAAVAGTLPDAALRGRYVVDAERTLWIPQHPTTTESTVADELGLYAGRPLARREGDAVLEAVGLHGTGDADPATLSPGELRRLAIARAVARVRHGAPVDVVLADEPTGHLDAENAERVRDVVVQLIAGRAALVATHDRRLAARLRGQRAPAESPGTTDAPHSDAIPGARDATPEASARGAAWRAVLGGLPRRRVALALAVGTVSALFAAALTGVSGWLIVSASHQPPMLHLMVAIVGVRFFGIGRSVARYTEQLLVHDALLTWASTTRQRVWDGLVASPRWWGRITRGGGSLEYLVTRLDEVRDGLPRVLFPPVTGLLAAAGVCTAIGAWAPDALWVALAATVLGWVVLPAVVVRIDAAARADVIEHRAWLARRVPVLLRAADQLRANGAAATALRAFTRHDGAASARLVATGRAESVAAAAAAGIASVGAVAALLASAGHGGETAAMSALLLLALAEPMATTATAAQNARSLDEGVRRLAAVLPSEDADLAEPATGTSPIDGLRAVDVDAGWEDGAERVLSGVSAGVVRGSWAVVSGPSGSGKSTLLAVLLGELAPGAGRIEVLRSGAWREAYDADHSRIAWCPQEAHLFDSSVRANLGLGRGDQGDPVTDQELLAALEHVGLGPWFEGKPDGLDTRIGSGGHALSGGQRQRLAVARALVARADVVLLDEPTAHLGEDEASSLIADLRAALADRAVVLVTHDERLGAAGDVRVRLGAVGAPA
ncbi:thiol reductant ABC exporter subunit CydC [Zhihengliuella halotolerans]|uniref:ATP-binding cassette subfamily C protein CydCD n=1 Tax=Zhihengliuella halotolerans TaxID=370736 RepID=A0A4Q8AAK2_9MICC|nr:thiol reductant ABC exporter subunit CydC [Zhihengliuella halotolerans]RZU61142.1 ATP-binding cassette subfamily C protein CydCD [Zhihengliuella halotolerans]